MLPWTAGAEAYGAPTSAAPPLNCAAMPWPDVPAGDDTLAWYPSGYHDALDQVVQWSMPEQYQWQSNVAPSRFTEVQTSPEAQVVASLAALDCQGTILASFPVQDATNEVELSMAPSDAVQPDGKLIEKQDRTTSEDADLGQDIASAVAEFLTFDEGESPEDDSPSNGREATTRFEGAVWEIQAGTSDKSEEAEVPAGVSDSSLRGAEFSRALRQLPLPAGLTQHHLQHVAMHRVIVGCLESLYLENVEPTTRRLQKRLRESRVPEFLVEKVLTICAHEPDTYTLKLKRHGQTLVVLTEKHLDYDTDGGSDSDCSWSEEMVEVVEEFISERCGSACAPQSVHNTYEPCSTQGTHGVTASSAPSKILIEDLHLSPPQSVRHDYSGSTASTVSPLTDVQTYPSSPESARTSASVGDSGIEGITEHLAFASPAPSTTPEEQQTGGSCGTDLRGRANYQSPSALAALLQAQGITTLMVRNLPNSVTQKRFIEELATSGFVPLCDYYYVPSTFGARVSKGYGFVNLVNSSAVSAFVNAWHGSRRFGIKASGPAINVSAAALQGRETNAKKLDEPRMRRVRNPALRPVVLDPQERRLEDGPEAARSRRHVGNWNDHGRDTFAGGPASGDMAGGGRGNIRNSRNKIAGTASAVFGGTWTDACGEESLTIAGPPGLGDAFHAPLRPPAVSYPTTSWW
uniref:RRM domain-containing protein n=1 Tax=Noctiluca scintillans TaxID=2966 RepID=A0A7S1AYD7_NOCSC|mmetsp:Transcript_65054/g.172283  ORF Transcript_65054/g.172283 Transcript_65054/m.172283 type:complete len:689 (+) Transcript_65054:138-2204(+)